MKTTFQRPDEPTKSTKKGWTGGKIALLVIGAVIALGIVGNATQSHTDSNGVSNGLGSNDASGDVTLGQCSVEYSVVTCKLDILNHSSKTSDYYIEAELDDSAGTNVGTGNALIQHVGPGQSALGDLTGVSSGSGSVRVKLTQVQRTAST